MIKSFTLFVAILLLSSASTLQANKNTTENISFKQSELNCTFNYDADYLPYPGAAVIDIDNDGKKEFFISGGQGQRDCLFVRKDGVFINMIEQTEINRVETSYGVNAIDIDNNGFVDLIVARESGLYAYLNTDGLFREKLIFDNHHPNSSIVDATVTDFDNDGDIDIYISTFLKAKFFVSASFNEPNNRQENFLLEQVGNMEFRNVTEDMGLSYSQNIFTAAFLDLNKDKLDDLVIATNTDKIRIYKNTGSKFVLAAEEGGYGFWMGLGVADIDNDGYPELFLSNSGSTVPDILLELAGDLKEDQNIYTKYALLKTEGDFKFNNILPEISSDDFSFGWGIVPIDLNFDNYPEFIIRQNYIKWFQLWTRILTGSEGDVLMNQEGRLVNIAEEINLNEHVFGFSALVADFTGDGLDDVVYINVDQPHTFYQNISTTEKKSFTVNFPMNVKYINPSVDLLLTDGSRIKKTLYRKQGSMSTQDSVLRFYFNKQQSVKEIIVTSSKGLEKKIAVKENLSSILIK